MKRLRFQIGFFIAARTVLNTGFRMVYPFLPVFARNLGVDIKTMSLALTARATAGAFGPLLAPSIRPERAQVRNAPRRRALYDRRGCSIPRTAFSYSSPPPSS